MKIQNSVVMVTGTNRGLGKALVEMLDQLGAKKVYAAARRPESIDIKLKQAELVKLRVDVTSQESINAASALAGDVQCLINNAGVLAAGSILDVDDMTMQEHFAVNCFGMLNMSRAMTPVLKKQDNAAIVNILTLLSLASMPGFAAYNASKAAAWSISQSLRASLASSAVKVISVFPGAIDTDMLRGIEIDKTSPIDVAAGILSGIENKQEDIFPDSMSKAVYAAWCNDHKAIEKQFASM